MGLSSPGQLGVGFHVVLEAKKAGGGCSEILESHQLLSSHWHRSIHSPIHSPSYRGTEWFSSGVMRIEEQAVFCRLIGQTELGGRSPSHQEPYSTSNNLRRRHSTGLRNVS